MQRLFPKSFEKSFLVAVHFVLILSPSLSLFALLQHFWIFTVHGGGKVKSTYTSNNKTSVIFVKFVFLGKRTPIQPSVDLYFDAHCVCLRLFQGLIVVKLMIQANNNNKNFCLSVIVHVLLQMHVTCNVVMLLRSG